MCSLQHTLHSGGTVSLMKVRLGVLRPGVSDEEDDGHEGHHQKDASDDEDCQVARGLLFLLIPEGQVGAEDALSWTEDTRRSEKQKQSKN
uniref:Uncharacterized protein n=1 Tax=Stegastes partitus TaxID=144197 RepID=A0A3B5ACU7_9TELE